MAFFNTNELFTSVSVPCTEGIDCEFGGLERISEEACIEQLDIIRTMHQLDMAEIAAAYKIRSIREAAGDNDDTDSDIQDELDEFETTKENAITDIFTKIKDALKKFFSNVFGFLKNLYAKMFEYTKSNKAFAEKYKPLVTELATFIDGANVKVTGYDIFSKGDSGVSQMETEYKKWVIESEHAEITANKSIVEIINSVKGGEVSEEAKAKLIELKQSSNDYNDNTTQHSIAIKKVALRGKAPITINYDSAKILKDLAVLEGLDSKELKKAEAAMKKSYSNTESTIKSAEAKFKKLPDEGDGSANKAILTEAANAALRMTISKRKDTLQSISVLRSCITDFADQIKRATVVAVSEGRKAKKAAGGDKKDS